MKIAGSEFDKIRLDLHPVKPGQILWNGLQDVPRAIVPKYRRVSLRVPSRVNVNILDMTKLVPSGLETICDAGSISFGVGLYSQVDLTLLDDDKLVIHDEANKQIIEHYLKIFKELTGYKGGFEVSTNPNEHKHIGLGSTASITCGVSLAVNTALGNPFNERELVKIESNNYVEKGPSEDLLFPGQSTGASGWVALKGGLCIVTSQNELAFRGIMPKAYHIVIGVPPLTDILNQEQGKGIADSDVEMPFLSKLRHYDRFNAAKICYWTLMELMPAVIGEDMRRFGDIVWDMVLTGSKGLPTILAHGTYKPIDCLLDIRKTGAEATFVSSVGPSIVTITSDEHLEDVRRIYTRYRCKIFEPGFDNKGYVILDKKEI